MTRRELAERYSEKTGRSVENVVYYYCFGLWKTAVVLQQIYFRYKQGLTRDPRFAALIMGVHVLAQTAVDAADSGKLLPRLSPCTLRTCFSAATEVGSAPCVRSGCQRGFSP